MNPDAPAAPLTATQRRVLERVDNPLLTSREQADAVKHAGNCFLTACPGAGKTRTVGLRLAYHASFHPDDSVAAVSHTNTAIDAIHAAARELTAIPDHYWVGTLHSFLLHYVVYPFGHLYMGCTDVPQIAGEDRDWPDDIPDVPAHGDYPGCRVKAWKFDVHVGARLTYQRPGDWPQPLTEDIIMAGLTEWAKDTKRDYWTRGLLSFSDVLWVAYRVLQLHAELAKAVAARFDELIVDEVQDTAELQLKCVEFLRAQPTHPRLVIVGDLGQAVYEWAGATPARLLRFAADQKLQELPLTANYRSSKRICAVTHRFCTRPDPDRAEGKHAAAAEPPELWRWERNEQPELVERFRERLAESDVPESQAAVLAWTNALVDRLNGRKASDKPVGSWLLRVLGTDGRRARRTHWTDRRDVPPAGPRRGLRRLRVRSAGGLNLRAARAHPNRQRPASGGVAEGGRRAAALEPQRPRRPRGGGDGAVGWLSRAERSEHNDGRGRARVCGRARGSDSAAALARTIHDAKGESLRAVLVVARDEDAVLWANSAWMEAPPDEMAEETRVAYVALTRAERLLVLAIPSRAADSVAAKFRAVGFSDPPTSRRAENG